MGLLFLATNIFFIVFIIFDYFWTTIPLNLKLKKEKKKKSMGGKNEERRERKGFRVFDISVNYKTIRSKERRKRRERKEEKRESSLPLAVISHHCCRHCRERNEEKRSPSPRTSFAVAAVHHRRRCRSLSARQLSPRRCRCRRIHPHIPQI